MRSLAVLTCIQGMDILVNRVEDRIELLQGWLLWPWDDRQKHRFLTEETLGTGIVANCEVHSTRRMLPSTYPAEPVPPR